MEPGGFQMYWIPLVQDPIMMFGHEITVHLTKLSASYKSTHQ